MDWCNSEGYHDPTACMALVSVAKTETPPPPRRPLVYVASPYAGDVDYNTSRARAYCRFAVSKGAIPLAAHLLFTQFMDDSDEEERALGLSFGLALLCKCNELWAFGDLVSKGMAAEIAKAKKCGKPVRRFNNKCEEIVGWN